MKETMICLCMLFLDLTQKLEKLQVFFRKNIKDMKKNTEHILKELGDCLWMIAEACTALNVDMESVMQMNIDKLKARFPEGFSSERSIHRKEGDI